MGDGMGWGLMRGSELILHGLIFDDFYFFKPPIIVKILKIF